MEKYLNKLISNRHLIYIIQEYSREKCLDIAEITCVTAFIKQPVDDYIFYNEFIICRNGDSVIKNKSKINHSSSSIYWWIFTWF